MLRILLIFLIINPFRITAQTVTETIYFFQNLEIREGTQLLLVTNRAQTHTAHLLGNRLYSDTSYMRKLKENSYKEIIDGISEVHLCGYDMYFYAVNGDEVRYLNAANSNCGLNDLGCEELDTMLFTGTPLYFDTLNIPGNEWNSKNDSILEKAVFTTSHWVDHWGIAQSEKFPRFYYDYYFEVVLKNEQGKSRRELIEQYVSTLTDDFNGFNWNYDYDDSINRIFEGPESRFQCYLKDFRKSDFTNMELKPVSKVFDPRDHYLILKP